MKTINWNYYEVYNFKPKIPPSYENYIKYQKKFQTCGSAALSVLTDIDPNTVEKSKPKSSKHWSDTAIVKFLRNKKYTVIPLSRKTITNLDLDSWQFHPINKNHLILLLLEINRTEGSYMVAYNNQLIHNFEPLDFGPLFLLNKPIQSAFLVWHPKWRY